MSVFKEVNAKEAKTIISGADLLVLDMRDAHSYQEGHIEGAMLAHDRLVESLIRKKDFERPVIIYCFHGNSSKDLAELFGRSGFKSVFSLTGGFVAWKKTNVS